MKEKSEISSIYMSFLSIKKILKKKFYCSFITKKSKKKTMIQLSFILYGSVAAAVLLDFWLIFRDSDISGMSQSDRIIDDYTGKILARIMTIIPSIIIAIRSMILSSREMRQYDQSRRGDDNKEYITVCNVSSIDVPNGTYEERSKYGDPDTCLICTERNVSVKVLPCEHRTMCLKCFRTKDIEYDYKCILCRSEVTTVLMFYKTKIKRIDLERRTFVATTPNRMF